LRNLSIRGYAKKLEDEVTDPFLGTTLDSLGEAYDFEHGLRIRYGKSRLNGEKTKCMHEIVCGFSRSVSVAKYEPNFFH
jgi:hypothetical protein